MNILFNGKATVKDNDGKAVTLRFDSNYPADCNAKITVECDGEAELIFKLRKPAWCEKMTVNGKNAESDGYYTLAGRFANGDSVDVGMQTSVKAHRLNGKIAFTYGALTLAADQQKSDRTLEKAVAVGDDISYRLQPKEKGEFVRMVCDLDNGDKLLLTDYQSCGKKWLSNKPMMTVWFHTDEK